MRDLEKRLREYELRGVQASSSLQIAARRVIQENARLRSLLTRRGVKDAEIESYLKVDTHGSDGGALDGLSARSILSSSTRSVYGQEQLTRSSSNTSYQKLIVGSSPQESASMVKPPRSAGVLNASEDTDCPQPSTCPITNRDQLIEGQRSPSQELTVCLHSSTNRLEKGKGIQNNMTPCMEAAMIIVSMNSGLSIEEANAELGCPPVNDCYVDNLTVFRVMDR
ncbi:MAG: hypothetical protein LQ342_004825 [Letrouitia transgressa]|nr:MAG: hypothetical protein LQ342_004825 [Letrouitia transgressa]